MARCPSARPLQRCRGLEQEGRRAGVITDTRLDGVFESGNSKNNVVPDEEAFLDRDNSQVMIAEETIVIG